MAHDNIRRRTPVARAIRPAAAGLIAVCLLAGGCGSSTPRPASSPKAFTTQELAFSKCMRAHGVPNFPDPGASVNGPANSIGGIEIPTTIDIESPAYKAAQHNCNGVLSAVFSTQGRPHITASLQATLIAHAQCMREHGVPNYQDPTFPASGGIAVTDAGTNPQSPAYEHATRVCGTR